MNGLKNYPTPNGVVPDIVFVFYKYKTPLGSMGSGIVLLKTLKPAGVESVFDRSFSKTNPEGLHVFR